MASPSASVAGWVSRPRWRWPTRWWRRDCSRSAGSAPASIMFRIRKCRPPRRSRAYRRPFGWAASVCGLEAQNLAKTIDDGFDRNEKGLRPARIFLKFESLPELGGSVVDGVDQHASHANRLRYRHDSGQSISDQVSA